MMMRMTHRLSGISLAALLVAMPSTLCAQESQAPEVEAINARYQEEWAQIRRDADRIRDEAPEGPETAVSVDCEMERQEIKLDIPEVTMRRQEMSLDLPQVTMRRHTMSWDVPETFMGTTVCGRYPEFHGFTVRWREIRCDLPQVRMVRREASLDIPEFTWDRTSFSMHVPEFTMNTQRWVFDLPRCRELSVATRHLEEDSRRLEARAAELSARQRQEVRAAVLSDLVQKREQTDASFRAAAAQIDSAIRRVREQGIDPTRVRLSSGDTFDLLAQLARLNQQRDEQLAMLDTSIRQMSA